jgi:hypothetical protein
MRKFLKIIGIIFLIIFIGIGVFLFRGYKFYKSIFRLSYEQINKSLEETPAECKKLSDCKLLPGDILIRRYITNTSDLFSKTLDPYFTHSALYLGNDELFEALGNDQTPENQIQITKLSQRDWLDKEMVNFVVIRPKDYHGKLDEISKNLRAIANDPEYVFGMLNEEKKTVSCSDIILKYLVENNIIGNLPDKPQIIPPDYLFFATQRDNSDFQVIGYNVTPI